MENVKQNTTKYKILFIFSFILLALLLFNTNVFASFEIEHNGTTYTLNEPSEACPEGWGKSICYINSNNYFIYYYDLSKTDFITVNQNTGASNSSTGKYSSYYIEDGVIKSSSNDSYYCYYYNSGKWEKTVYPYIPAIGGFSSNSSSYNIYSDLDIYFQPKDNYLTNQASTILSDYTMVFQGPVQGMTLAQVLEEEPKQVTAKIQETLMTLIPVGIIVLAILLVVYLIASKRWLPM